MRHSETVTFGGSGLDRAAHLRGDRSQQSRMMRATSSRSIALWRGKILAEGQNLVRLPMEHAIFANGNPDTAIFLGYEGSSAIFAHDISNWEPPKSEPDPEQDQFTDQSVQRHPTYPEGCFIDLKLCMAEISARDAELAATARSLFSWHGSHGFCARCGERTEIGMAGWQRDCPACTSSHFPRTDPVVIMLVTRGNSTLLGRGNGWPEGMFSCLAGYMEPGETIEAAARREVFEESGIRVGQVEYLASQPWAFPSSLMIGCCGEALSESISIDPVEIAEARWVTKEELAAALSGINPGLRPARKGSIAQFLLTNWLADRLK